MRQFLAGRDVQAILFVANETKEKNGSAPVSNRAAAHSRDFANSSAVGETAAATCHDMIHHAAATPIGNDLFMVAFPS